MQWESYYVIYLILLTNLKSNLAIHLLSVLVDDVKTHSPLKMLPDRNQRNKQYKQIQSKWEKRLFEDIKNKLTKLPY